MAHENSRRLSVVMPYLYPDLKSGVTTGDYHLQNDSDGNGTFLVWHPTEENEGISEPTAQQLADAKEAAVDENWWRLLRKGRNEKLVESDWSQGTDVPSSLKTEYATYRGKLRDLPTTVTKPAYADLIELEVTTSGIEALMPTKPS